MGPRGATYKTCKTKYKNRKSIYKKHSKLNSWLSEEELQRFSGFNVGEWDRLRNGAHLEPSVMNHQELPGMSIVDNPVMGEKNLDFLNQTAVRSTQQNAFFEQFSNGSESQQKPDNSDRNPNDKSVDTQRKKIGGTIPSNTSGASGGGTI